MESFGRASSWVRYCSHEPRDSGGLYGPRGPSTQPYIHRCTKLYAGRTGGNRWVSPLHRLFPAQHHSGVETRFMILLCSFVLVSTRNIYLSAGTGGFPLKHMPVIVACGFAPSREPWS